jgi:hypothetical protein
MQLLLARHQPDTREFVLVLVLVIVIVIVIVITPNLTLNSYAHD